jgi:hypothetical protein
MEVGGLFHAPGRLIPGNGLMVTVMWEAAGNWFQVYDLEKRKIF